MNGTGFAYFRWRCNLRWALAARLMGNPNREQVLLSIWRDLQQRAFHRKMARPKEKRT